MALNQRHNIDFKEADQMFADQMKRAEKALLEVDEVLRGKRFSDASASFLETFVEKSGSAQTFTLESNVTLPFDTRVAKKALWGLLTSDNIQKYCYLHRVSSAFHALYSPVCILE